MSRLISIGKRIAYILRHNPGRIKMDTQGYVKVSDLLNELGTQKIVLDQIVRTDNKGRYSYDESGEMIRANQGHSIPFVNITFKELEPPTYLYHGTSPLFVDSILDKGLKKMSRQYVHLSEDIVTAKIVGKRHSKNVDPTIFIIDSLRMYNDGFKFYLSDNNVWLTDTVPPKYIKY